MDAQPFVVQFGAGAIGRGFFAPLWCAAGFETVFVDVDAALVGALNAAGAYPLELVESDMSRVVTVAPVRACFPADAPIAGAAFVATAVGVGIFARLAPVLAAGIVARAASAVPLNIVCGENQAGAGSLLRAAVAPLLPDDPTVRAYFEASVGFVDASVGRMVPPPEPGLAVRAEPYATLPIDADAWRGELPSVPGLLPAHNFAGYVARKLFTHNGGHALLAYEGVERGHAYIWEAAQDPALVDALLGFWRETGAALVAEFGFDPDDQRAHEENLLHRFRNRALGDTLERVGRDPARKLRRDDRLVGAALLCQRHGIPCPHVRAAIDAAMRVGGLTPDDVDLPEYLRAAH